MAKNGPFRTFFGPPSSIFRTSVIALKNISAELKLLWKYQRKFDFALIFFEGKFARLVRGLEKKLRGFEKKLRGLEKKLRSKKLRSNCAVIAR